MEELTRIRGTPVYWDPDKAYLKWTSGGTVDADGSPRAYGPATSDKPRGSGLDYNSSAGYPHGGWRNVLVEDPHTKDALIQDGKTPAQPNKGMFMSMTTYRRKAIVPIIGAADARLWLDSENVCYGVVPGALLEMIDPVFIGCLMRVHVEDSDILPIDLVCGDVSDNTHLGEYSMKIFKGLGLNDSPISGGTESPIITCELWPGKAAYVDGEQFELQPRHPHHS